MPTESPKKFFEYISNHFFFSLNCVKQRVSLSLFFPINIILLLGKPLSEKISSVKEKPSEGGSKFSSPRVGSFEGGLENSSFWLGPRCTLRPIVSLTAIENVHIGIKHEIFSGEHFASQMRVSG